MKKASKMIDLGRKPASLDAKPEAKKDEPYYPSMNLSTEHPIAFPKGHFMAKVKLKVKRSEASADETGKTRHSYTLDLHGIHPGFDAAEKEDPAEEAAETPGEEAKEDAAMALMHSMGRMRDKKFMAHKSD